MTTYDMLYRSIDIYVYDRRGYKSSSTSGQGATHCAFLCILRWYVSTFYVWKNCQLTRYQLSLSIKKCNVNVRCKVNKVSITIFWVSVGQEGKATRTPCVSHSNDRLLTFPCYIVAHVWNTYNCWNTWTNVRFLQKTTENYKL